MKQRLYVFNRDQLVQLEREERVQRLEATVDSVESGYEKCLERVEKREATAGGGDGISESEGVASKKRLGKRKVVDEDEDDVEEGAEVERVVAVNGHKKVRAE